MIYTINDAVYTVCMYIYIYVYSFSRLVATYILVATGTCTEQSIQVLGHTIPYARESNGDTGISKNSNITKVFISIYIL
jgi:hypothetical protein